MIANPTSLNGMPPPDEAEHRWRRAVGRHLRGISLSLMVVLFLGVILAPYMVKTIPSGHVGVLWKRFSGPGIYCWCILQRGTVLRPEEIREEGLHVIWPWDELFVYDLRLQSNTETFNTISKDGVNVTAAINMRTQLNHDSVPVLHKFIGPAYIARVVSPEIGSRAREVISQYDAEQVYSTKRQEIEQLIRQGAREKLSRELSSVMQPEASEQTDADKFKAMLKGAIIIIDTLVLSIELPPTVVSAINRKAEQYYLVQEYKYRVERETLESARKRIEAEGIRDFQKTVSQGISDSYLRWRGIEATVQLSQSSNSKIVVIGSGKDGLPIILGNVDTPANTAPKPADGADGDKKADEKKADADKKPAADAAKPADAAPADKPADKTPVADAKPADKTPTDGSGDSSGKPRALLPLSFSDLEKYLAKFLKAKDADSKPAADKPAADKQAEEKAK